jgi:ribonuclease HII
MESGLRKSGFNFVAGMDEAGRGPMAGPVCCAAVILKDGARIPGLNDSKKLSARQRLKLFDIILKNALDYAIVLVPHQIIDEINILNSVRFGNQLCVEALETKPDIILIDGRDKQFLTENHKTIIKGDSKIRSIAAASILAKVTRDKVMKKYSEEFPNYEFERHMGYGTRLHRALLKRFGPCEIHRKSYSFHNEY